MIGDLEKTEEDKFTDMIRDLPYPSIALKLILSGMRGWPDRTVFCRGQVLFFEFKRSNKKGAYGQRPQQGKWQNNLERLGFKYFIVYTAKEAIKIFHENIKE